MVTKTAGGALDQSAGSFMESSLRAISEDPSEVVRVSGIRVLQAYLQTLPRPTTQPLQSSIINAISNFLSGQDLSDLTDSDDLIITLVETLRDAIMVDTRICVTSSALDVLFSIASHGAGNFQLAMLVTESFEEITESMATLGGDAYVRLCEKVLPSLTGAFDVGNLTQENALTNLAADLLAVLTEHASEPLPQGFVSTVMPKLNRLLLTSPDGELLRPATLAVKHMLIHDYAQFFAWNDSQTGKAGLEVTLLIIDRLLGPSVDDNAAAEVGGLAAELVEKAGSERLGPYLLQLLRAVAMRLATATEAQFIQSLILVFARLSLVNAKEVLDFLDQVQLPSAQTGLEVVMSKWLENSVNFAGYEEIRQNVIALSKIYNLNDERLSRIHVRGDLIVPESDRIMTRSRARQNPDQHTIVPVPLKILKVLIEEMSSASGNSRSIDAAAAAELADDDSDDGDWEDEPNILDLGSASVRQGKPDDVEFLSKRCSNKMQI